MVGVLVKALVNGPRSYSDQACEFCESAHTRHIAKGTTAVDRELYGGLVLSLLFSPSSDQVGISQLNHQLDRPVS